MSGTGEDPIGTRPPNRKQGWHATVKIPGKRRGKITRNLFSLPGGGRQRSSELPRDRLSENTTKREQREGRYCSQDGQIVDRQRGHPQYIIIIVLLEEKYPVDHLNDERAERRETAERQDQQDPEHEHQREKTQLEKMEKLVRDGGVRHCDGARS